MGWRGLRRRAVPVMHMHLLPRHVDLSHLPDRHQGGWPLMAPFERLQGGHNLALGRFPQGQELFPQAAEPLLDRQAVHTCPILLLELDSKRALAKCLVFNPQREIPDPALHAHGVVVAHDGQINKHQAGRRRVRLRDEALSQVPESGHELEIEKALRAQPFEEELAALIATLRLLTYRLPCFRAVHLVPPLHRAHHRTSVPPELLVVPLVSLPSGLKPGLEIRHILSDGDMAGFVAMKPALGQGIRSRNVPSRVSRLQPIIDGHAGGVSANTANTWHANPSLASDGGEVPVVR
jgi:hypothetical protein